MIVRISGEGQFELPDADADRLNELDNLAVAAAEEGSGVRCSRWSSPTGARSRATSSSPPT
jgi:hypothetical protein